MTFVITTCRFVMFSAWIDSLITLIVSTWLRRKVCSSWMSPIVEFGCSILSHFLSCSLAFLLVMSRQASMMTTWMERFGAPTCLSWITCMTALTLKLNANMMFRLVKGIRFVMSRFLSQLWLVSCLALRFFILATISEATIDADVK